MFEAFNTVELLTGFGAGCAAGYGFAMRVLLPSMLASKVKPLEVMIKNMQDDLEDIAAKLQAETEFNHMIQEKLFGLDNDEDRFNGVHAAPRG